MERRVRIHLGMHLKGGGLSKVALHLRSSGKARGMGRATAEHPAAMLVLRESEVRTAESRRGEPDMGTEEAPPRKQQIAKRRVEKGDLLWRIREWAGGHTTWQRK